MIVLPAPASSASRNRIGHDFQNLVVDRRTLVGKRVDQRDLSRKCRAGKVPTLEPNRLGDRRDGFGVAAEVKLGVIGLAVDDRACGNCPTLFELLDPRPTEFGGVVLAILPAAGPDHLVGSFSAKFSNVT